MRLRLSDSVRFGPFRLRLSVPLGKGRAYTTESVRVGPFRLSASQPLGGRKRRGR